ncbi:MAG: GNAT family N-acetyltransferase [Spirochaetes bacterium]|nr:GNAT family N-acetyltransferase [Spirochaetota bacterium]
MPAVTIRRALPGDLDRCCAIESACYGPEGATRERIEMRIHRYPEGFLVAAQGGLIVGFINSCATRRDELSGEELKDMVGHETDGENMVVFSLAVDPPCRGLGYSTMLMREFIGTARRLGKSAILLLCRQGMVAYYRRYGFLHRGASGSTHGGLRWQEMRLPLLDTPPRGDRAPS